MMSMFVYMLNLRYSIMDQNATNVVAYVAFITGVGGAIYTAINRGHIRSMCCGRILEASVVIDRLPPSPPPPVVIPPPLVDMGVVVKGRGIPANEMV